MVRKHVWRSNMPCELPRVRFFEFNPPYYWCMIDVVDNLLFDYLVVKYTLQDYHDAKATYNAGDEL